MDFRLFMISKGNYGYVYHVKLDGKQYAVKIDKKGRNTVRDERFIHLKLYYTLEKKCRSYVPKPVPDGEVFEKLKVIVDNKRIHAMEFSYGTPLGKTLKIVRDQHVIAKIRQNVKNALMCLWKAGFIHGDLHLDNILVHEDNLSVQIIDFGFTIHVPPLKSDTLTDIRKWFRVYWPRVLEVFRIAKGNPNAYAFGLFDRYPKNIQMFATKDIPLFKKLHIENKFKKTTKSSSNGRASCKACQNKQ